MLVIRNVFRCKPGQAKNLVAKFKEGLAAMEDSSTRLLVDVSADFWTVVVENNVESFESWEKFMEERGGRPEVQKAMEGYMDLVEGGYREIFRVE